MKKLFYTKSKDDFKIECFKLDDVDELTQDAYEIIGTNTKTGDSETFTTALPQAAVALADEVFSKL